MLEPDHIYKPSGIYTPQDFGGSAPFFDPEKRYGMVFNGREIPITSLQTERHDEHELVVPVDGNRNELTAKIPVWSVTGAMDRGSVFKGVMRPAHLPDIDLIVMCPQLFSFRYYLEHRERYYVGMNNGFQPGSRGLVTRVMQINEDIHPNDIDLDFNIDGMDVKRPSVVTFREL